MRSRLVPRGRMSESCEAAWHVLTCVQPVGVYRVRRQQSRFHRCRILAAILASGMVFQTVGCQTVAASLSAGLASSISTAFIGNVVRQALNLESPFGGFGGF